ncbi:MAG: NADH-quinone oxidoreductase subunit C [Puniceicoccales bacterium]|jgi:NADH-quinone oxidoreductase subunit C|nr:NADH-quinone oxidoreductase subunit C [Puniceicoccales bacterium]
MPDSELQTSLLAKFPYLTPRPGSVDHAAVNVPPSDLVAFTKSLRDELKFDMLTDMTACDWDKDSPRFTAIYHFYNTSTHQYLRVACTAPDDENPEVPSLVSLHPSANWFEREAYDMFGIKFSGHPDLRRILMWDDYKWHPLRKEFPLAGHEVELPAVDVFEGSRTKIEPAPMAGGPFVATPGKTMHDAEPRGKDQSWSETNSKPANK